MIISGSGMMDDRKYHQCFCKSVWLKQILYRRRISDILLFDRNYISELLTCHDAIDKNSPFPVLAGRREAVLLHCLTVLPQSVSKYLREIRKYFVKI